ncbi:LysE family transporter [bacterium]|nr:LysE family transporter [bacterium]
MTYDFIPIILKGLALGWSVAWPPGPINTEMIRRGLNGSFWGAYSVGLGACCGDFIWAVATALGVGLLLDQENVRPILGIISFLLLLYLAYIFLKGAWVQWRKQKRGEPIVFDPKDRSTRRGFFLGWTMAMLSPWNLAFWLAVMGAQTGDAMSLGESLLLATAVVTGASAWGLVLTISVKFGARFTSPAWETVTRAVTGLLMLAFAGMLLWNIFE